MHPRISENVNRLFYDDKIIDNACTFDRVFVDFVLYIFFLAFTI